MEREKILNGLRCHAGCERGFDCDTCDYIGNGDCSEILARDALNLLKEQEAKTGYWIDIAGNDKCSNCGTEYSDLYPDYGNTHFCPNCGAKMESR